VDRSSRNQGSVASHQSMHDFSIGEVAIRTDGSLFEMSHTVVPDPSKQGCMIAVVAANADLAVRPRVSSLLWSLSVP